MNLKINSFGGEALGKFTCDVMSRGMNKFRMPALAMVIYVLFLLFFSAGFSVLFLLIAIRFLLIGYRL